MTMTTVLPVVLGAGYVGTIRLVQETEVNEANNELVSLLFVPSWY